MDETRSKFVCRGSNAPFNQRFTVIGETPAILDSWYTPTLRFFIARVSRSEKTEGKKKKKKKTITPVSGAALM